MAQEKRNAVMQITCRPSEKDLMKRAADAADKKLADWVRTLAVAAARQEVGDDA